MCTFLLLYTSDDFLFVFFFNFIIIIIIIICCVFDRLLDYGRVLMILIMPILLDHIYIIPKVVLQIFKQRIYPNEIRKIQWSWVIHFMSSLPRNNYNHSNRVTKKYSFDSCMNNCIIYIRLCPLQLFVFVIHDRK